MKALVVVVPCYNEEAGVAALVGRVLAAPMPEGWTSSLLVVDDGSTDGTLAAAEALAGPRLRLLPLRSNGGVQKAVLAGLRAAGGDAAAVMDADLQDPPELLAPMLRLLDESGAEAVIGLKTARADASPALAAAKTLAMSVLPFARGEGDFCVLARPAVERLVARGRDETPFRVRRRWALRGLPAAYFPYERQPRRAGRGSFNWRSLSRLWLRMALELARGAP